MREVPLWCVVFVVATRCEYLGGAVIQGSLEIKDTHRPRTLR